jgi:hypothetical protein
MTKEKITWSPATRKFGDLIKNGYNPRKLSENERRDLEKSVKEFGTLAPEPIPSSVANSAPRYMPTLA